MSQIKNILSKYSGYLDDSNTIEEEEQIEKALINELEALFSLHSVVVPKGTFCKCKEENKQACTLGFCMTCGDEI